MTDIIEGMARAMWLGVNPHKSASDMGLWEDHPEESKRLWRAAAQAAMDYLKQPHPASKPSSEGQGPELSQEQIVAMNLEVRKEAMKPVWQPLIDSLTGKAP